MLANPYDGVKNYIQSIEESTGVKQEFSSVYNPSSAQDPTKTEFLGEVYKALASKMQSFANLDTDTKKALGLMILDMNKQFDKMLFKPSDYQKKTWLEKRDTVQKNILKSIAEITPAQAIKSHSPEAIAEREKIREEVKRLRVYKKYNTSLSDQV